MNPAPLLLSVNYQYFSRLLNWRKLSYQWAGLLPKIEGFDNYNRLISINQMFSTRPFGDPVDRTGTISGPLNFRILRHWTVPQTSLAIEKVFESRVKYYTDQNCQLNLFWSGGTDSTAMVTAFLKHAPALDQLRLIYSPQSLYENRDFFEFVTKQFPVLDTLDFSGDVYLNTEFNGIIITGHGGDEFTASLDESFFDQVGADVLQQDWRRFFQSKSADSALIDFCEEYFAKSGRPIDTVLEARWWFYAATKSQVFGPRDVSFLFNHSSATLNQFASFFDCDLFESYMWHNTDKIIEPGQGYNTYKKFLRQYVYDFYKNTDYLHNTVKISSMQFQAYRLKKIELLDLRWICILEDAAVIRTKNLPLLSQKEFVDTYGNSLDYLFNQPHYLS
jgi:hypothetical protein